MAGSERPRSTELLTPEGRDALRNRPSVAEILATNHWLTIAVAAVIGGGAIAAGLLVGGVSIAWSLLGGAAMAATIAVFFVIASIVLRRPVVPELFVGQNEPGELEEMRWDTELDAAREARRRNLKEGTRGSYWIEVEVEPGTWGIERRRQLVTGMGDPGGGGWFDGGGGGGNGGG